MEVMNPQAKKRVVTAPNAMVVVRELFISLPNGSFSLAFVEFRNMMAEFNERA
jgi:hypothetical protein